LIRNAVVPVAGLGTRLLPATKSQPKEMLPVAKKPIVQYVVEELARAGVDRLLFITGRGKASIENHFDQDPELVGSLQRAAKNDLLEELEFENLAVDYLYTRQAVQRGLGDAILHGQPFTGDEPFLVALGDSIIGLNGGSDICGRMADAYSEYGAAAVIAVEEVQPHQTKHYGIVRPSSDGDVFTIADLVEKPTTEQAPSNLAIAGRYVFAPAIFDKIRAVEPDGKGEIQLTDAIRMLCSEAPVIGVKLAPGERRYDIGNFASYYETFLEFALADPEHGPELGRRLERLLAARRDRGAGAHSR
jgi:UTP--glucose-1-phosphate uridylyltransferase